MVADKKAAFDMQGALGATDTFSLQKISIYLPNKDRDECLIFDIENWIEAGMRVLAEINLGVTRLPPAIGYWVDTVKERTIKEDTHVIYSFIRQPDKFQEKFDKIRAFVHSFGKKTNQGEVMVEFFGEDGDGGFCSRAYVVANFLA